MWIKDGLNRGNENSRSVIICGDRIFSGFHFGQGVYYKRISKITFNRGAGSLSLFSFVHLIRRRK